MGCMRIQNSYQKGDKGTLYLVPTPIGNLEDMTFRAVHMLRDADIILAEDTRHTQKLLNHFSIKNTLLSFHEHNKMSRLEQVMERIHRGETLALVSDAGMPAISDPGYDLVKRMIEEEAPVIVLPGATAAICALVGSGLPTNEFLFYGFLPRKNQEKKAVLQRLKGYQATIIFYESPYRIKDTLRFILKEIGNRQIVIAREITKIHEQYRRGTCQDVLQGLEETTLKGECCIILEGNPHEERLDDDTWWEEMSLVEHVAHYEEEKGLSNKEALRQVAIDRNLKKRDVYQAIHMK